MHSTHFISSITLFRHFCNLSTRHQRCSHETVRPTLLFQNHIIAHNQWNAGKKRKRPAYAPSASGSVSLSERPVIINSWFPPHKPPAFKIFYTFYRLLQFQLRCPVCWFLCSSLPPVEAVSDEVLLLYAAIFTASEYPFHRLARMRSFTSYGTMPHPSPRWSLPDFTWPLFQISASGIQSNAFVLRFFRSACGNVTAQVHTLGNLPFQYRGR